jgi:16S rRNA (adenine1518-N6/adenine1519-N6)-dimethyltransferase
MIKKLGQNFLVNKKIAEKEVSLADVNSNDVVLEVGPGKGVLTNLLAEKAKKVICIEIDIYLVSFLKKMVSDNVLLINKDVLDVDFNNIPCFNKIVSNLPYQISSPVTFKFLDFGFDLGVFIYQKEFAERLVAKPGSKNYSRLSVSVYYKSFCEIIQTVSKGCFYPVPRVDSSIVRMIPRDKPPFLVKDEQFFFNLVRNLFNYRRKKIGRILKNVYGLKDLDDLPFVDKRVERLSPERIGLLSDNLLEYV